MRVRSYVDCKELDIPPEQYAKMVTLVMSYFEEGGSVASSLIDKLLEGAFAKAATREQIRDKSRFSFLGTSEVV